MSKPSVLQVAKSVIAAAAGIQSQKNREQDFQHGSLSAYVIGGVLFTITFIGVIVLIVSMVL
jgi:diacylglycerol kinase